jgi:hypothetical protein
MREFEFIGFDDKKEKVDIDICPFCSSTDLLDVGCYNDGFLGMYYIDCGNCQVRMEDDDLKWLKSSWNRENEGVGCDKDIEFLKTIGEEK